MHTDTVTAILENYAQKGVFRSLHAEPPTYRMMWHHDRSFELTLDEPNRKLSFPRLLPGIPAASEMYKEFKAFLVGHHSKELPDHRRTDPKRARLSCSNQKGVVTVTLTSKDGDFDYATRKFIHTVHEIFLVFLADGPYYEYLVEHFGLDPDKY